MVNRLVHVSALTGFLCLSLFWAVSDNAIGIESVPWSKSERQLLGSLWIGNLSSIPMSPGNPVADDLPAAELGHRIFFDPAFSGDGTVSCATCHQPDQKFSDGLSKGQAMGTTKRRTLSVIGAVYSPWLFWDGRSDSLWSQALSPLESPVEHGGTRTQYLHLIANDKSLREPYEKLFGLLPSKNILNRIPLNASPKGSEVEVSAWEALSDKEQAIVNRVFSNIGRLLEAYQRLLIPGPAKFDGYLEGIVRGNEKDRKNLLTTDEIAGLRLFIGKARCIHCHNGPLLSNNEFHNTGLFPYDTLPIDRGRIDAVRELLVSEFNCLSVTKPSTPYACDELRFVKTHGLELVAAFRTPSLRNLNEGPFMHTGQFNTLLDVMNHYNTAQATLISDDLEPLGLSAKQIEQVIRFLDSVKSRPAVADRWLSSPLVLSR